MRKLLQLCGALFILCACGRGVPTTTLDGGTISCGGLVGGRCPAGSTCQDDPRDQCAPPKGADCPGLCYPN